MILMKKLMNPNFQITLGISWFIIALIYITDKLLDNQNIRLVDWLGWAAMFTAGTLSIINGLRLKKDNHQKLLFKPEKSRLRIR